MQKLCETCAHWEKVADRGPSGSFGLCECVHLILQVRLENDSNFEEDSVIFTENKFGCIHHQVNNGTILGLDDAMEEDEEDDDN